MALCGCYNYTMTTPKTATCDACLEGVAPDTLTEICGDLVCATCITDADNHYNPEDLGDFNEDWDFTHDDWAAKYDDDPNPYHGNYSEM